jgi:hypothetical protein
MCHTQAAGAAAKAAEPAKQQDAKKALQHESKREQQMQQRMQEQQAARRAGRDTDRARDIKRGKATQEDEKKQQALDAARKKEEEAKEDAAKVRCAAEQFDLLIFSQGLHTACRTALFGCQIRLITCRNSAEQQYNPCWAGSASALLREMCVQQHWRAVEGSEQQQRLQQGPYACLIN